MDIKKKNQMIYKDAFDYLKNHSIGLTDEILNEYLVCEKLETMDEIFACAVKFVYDWYKPKRMVIEYNESNMKSIENLLHNYNLSYFITEYSYNPQKLYEHLMGDLILKDPESNFTDKVIRIYVNVLCGVATYLSNFKSKDELYEHFISFITPNQKFQLITEVQEASHSANYCDEGWGVKLAENWIKDVGMEDFCKTDTHVTKFILGLKLSEKNQTNKYLNHSLVLLKMQS